MTKKLVSSWNNRSSKSGPARLIQFLAQVIPKLFWIQLLANKVIPKVLSDSWNRRNGLNRLKPEGTLRFHFATATIRWRRWVQNLCNKVSSPGTEQKHQNFRHFGPSFEGVHRLKSSRQPHLVPSGRSVWSCVAAVAVEDWPWNAQNAESSLHDCILKGGRQTKVAPKKIPASQGKNL